MMTWKSAAGFVLLVAGLCAGAATSLASDPPLTFERALEAAKNEPLRADYTQLRRLYAADGSYRPHIHMDNKYEEHFTAMRDASWASDYDGVIEHATAILQMSYLEITPHFVVAWAYENQGDSEKAGHHREFANGLLRSIMKPASGGKYVVISISEERAVLMALRYEDCSQALVFDPETDTSYDSFSCTSPDGSKVSIRFNIDAFFSLKAEENGK